MSHTLTPHEVRTESGKRRWMVTCSCGWVRAIPCLNEKRALESGTRDHIDNLKPPCPTPGKKRFKTREKASAELRLFWRTSGKGKVMPNRVYQCPCGYWHMTSKVARR